MRSVSKTVIITLVLFIFLSISCEKDKILEIDYPNDKIIPTLVCVKIKDNYTIDKVFGFINSFDYDVERITNRIYKSSLPPDSLNYIIDYITNKSYTNDGGNKWFLAYVGYKTKIINILPKLYNMRNIDNQSDWLQTMSTLKLSEVTGNKMGTSIITFHVPEGHERECAEKFEEYNFVQWARFYYKNVQIINPYP